jgi:hypothetical protein
MGSVTVWLLSEGRPCEKPKIILAATGKVNTSLAPPRLARSAGCKMENQEHHEHKTILKITFLYR